MPFQNAATAVTNLYKGKFRRVPVPLFYIYDQSPLESIVPLLGFCVEKRSAFRFRGKIKHLFRWLATGFKSYEKFVSFSPKPESADAHQRSHDLGIQIGCQRRNKEVLAWVKKRRRTIRREDLISFLCGKAPPPRTARAPPRVTMVPTSRPSTPETGSSVETDLQPFREAIALHGGFQ